MPDQTPASQPVANTSAEGRYAQLEAARSPFLQAGREASELTVPGLLPPEGTNTPDSMPTPFQSLGARAVNNLASNLLLVLFPPGAPFFRLKLAAKMLKELRDKLSDRKDIAQEFEQAFSRIEKTIMDALEASNARTVLVEALKHLIVAGNVLLQVLKDGDFKFYTLDSFVIVRDLEGQPIEIIFREGLSPATLPPKVREIVERVTKEKGGDQPVEKTIWLYTRVRFESPQWFATQEVMGQIVPDSEGHYPKSKSPFIPLRWSVVSKESYGRGLIQEYIGDLRSLESLSASIVKFAAACAKILFMVNEGGVTSKRAIQNADSGDIVDGDAKDVTVLQVEKFADFQVASSTAERLEKRLEQAFLLFTSVQRNAERVTAEEIRFLAGELEKAFGGVYSTLSRELQLPLVQRYMANLQRMNLLPAVPEGAIDPQIITGLDGLGRNADLARLDAFLAGLGQQFGPEAIAEYVNVGVYANRRAIALGIEVGGGLLRSEEEVQKSRQATAQREMIGKLGPQAIRAATSAQPQQQGE